MPTLVSRSLCLLLLFSAPLLAGPMCITQTLDNYIALGAGGCQIGGLNVVDFSFAATAGNNFTILASDITVTPTVSGATLDLNFASPKFNLPLSTEVANYTLAYTWDPGDIRSLEDILAANSPVSPGFANITTTACLDAAFSPTCGTTTGTVTVSDNGITLVATDTLPISPSVGTLGIQNAIQLNANGASSEIASFDNQISTPEPSFFGACLFAGGLFLLRRPRAHNRARL